jgi:hypothetical protein
VVSTQSFQMLVQWICLGRVVFGELAPGEAITTAIEFARLADMCGVTGMESLIAENIKAIILANPAPADWEFYSGRTPDTSTHCLTSQHISSAVALPERHSVRGILAAASVEGYLRDNKCKLLKETLEIPDFSVDLLRAMRATLESLTYEEYKIIFKDPISGKKLKLLKA